MKDETPKHVRSDDVTYEDVGSITGATVAELKEEDRAVALKGAQILALSLQKEGVDVIFGYPGGANLEIFDVLPSYGIEVIRVEHEQGAVHAAQGYARVTGKVGVCLATSGPGATNLVTGIADANSDSTPIVCITGNVPTPLLGKNAFQEVDITSITKPITKKSYLVKQVGNIPKVVKLAFQLANGNRPGPVLIDIPKDIQQHYPLGEDGQYVQPRIPAVVEPAVSPVGGILSSQLEECCRMIREAKRPVIYAGGGVISADCAELLQQLAVKLSCPVTTTIMGLGAFPPEHELALHVLGMHGTKYANVAINEADLVLALGVRFDDRVTGKVSEFIKHGKIIHIDIDRNELNKNKPVTLPVCADLSIALQQLLDSAVSGEYADWLAAVAKMKQEYPLSYVDDETLIKPQFAIDQLSKITGGEAIVSLGVGQHQMWAMQYYQSRTPRAFLSSSGFGTMGYGLPAAIGAKKAFPNKTVIDIDGDGSFNMTIHELSTCHRYGLGVKVVVLNNQWLGMVRQWQDMIYDGHRSGSDLSDPMSSHEFSLDASTAVKAEGEIGVYPDFITIAKGYRVAAERVTKKCQLADAYARMLADPHEPYVLDVVVPREENVFPMIPAGGTYKDILLSEKDMNVSSKESQGCNI